MKRTNGSFFMFPNYLIDQGIFALMTPYEAKVLMVIARGCSNEKGNCCYTMESLAKKTGLNIKTIYSVMNGLERFKVIKKWHKQIAPNKLKNFYRISWGGAGIRESFEHDEAVKKESAERQAKILKNKAVVLDKFKDKTALGVNISSLVGNTYISRTEP
jgi:hypothetical protein